MQWKLWALAVGALAVLGGIHWLSNWTDSRLADISPSPPPVNTPIPPPNPVKPIPSEPAQPAVSEIPADLEDELGEEPAYHQPPAPATTGPPQYPTIIDAARAGDVEDVKRHLAYGANPNCRDNISRSPLHLAAMGGQHPEVVRVLLEHGAMVDIRDSVGDTPLFYAINFTATGSPPIELPVVEILLEFGADPLAKNMGDYTPLRAAEGHPNQQAIVDLLRQYIKQGM